MMIELAQATTELNGILEQLATPAGIVGLTLLIVEVVKRKAGSIAVFNKVPLFIYSILIALGLTAVATYIFKVHEVPGETWQNQFAYYWDVAEKAAAASGLYTWLTGKAKKTPEQQLIES